MRFRSERQRKAAFANMNKRIASGSTQQKRFTNAAITGLAVRASLPFLGLPALALFERLGSAKGGMRVYKALRRAHPHIAVTRQGPQAAAARPATRLKRAFVGNRIGGYAKQTGLSSYAAGRKTAKAMADKVGHAPRLIARTLYGTKGSPIVNIPYGTIKLPNYGGLSDQARKQLGMPKRARYVYNNTNTMYRSPFAIAHEYGHARGRAIPFSKIAPLRLAEEMRANLYAARTLRKYGMSWRSIMEGTGANQLSTLAAMNTQWGVIAGVGSYALNRKDRGKRPWQLASKKRLHLPEG